MILMVLDVVRISVARCAQTHLPSSLNLIAFYSSGNLTAIETAESFMWPL